MDSHSHCLGKQRLRLRVGAYVNMLVANQHVAYDSDVYFHTVKTIAAVTVISRIVVFIVVLGRV